MAYTTIASRDINAIDYMSNPVVLSNGWIITSEYYTTSSYGTLYIYRSTDGGNAFSQLCYIANINSGQGYMYKLLAQSTGTTVWIVRQAAGTFSVQSFDAATVGNGDLGSSYVGGIAGQIVPESICIDSSNRIVGLYYTGYDDGSGSYVYDWYIFRWVAGTVSVTSYILLGTSGGYASGCLLSNGDYAVMFLLSNVTNGYRVVYRPSTHAMTYTLAQVGSITNSYYYQGAHMVRLSNGQIVLASRKNGAPSYLSLWLSSTDGSSWTGPYSDPNQIDWIGIGQPNLDLSSSDKLYYFNTRATSNVFTLEKQEIQWNGGTSFTWSGASTIYSGPPNTTNDRYNINYTMYNVSTVRSRHIGGTLHKNDYSTPYSGAGVRDFVYYGLALNSAPTAPINLSPGGGTVVANSGVTTFSWTFTDSDPGDTQTVFRFQVFRDSGLTDLLGDTGYIGSPSQAGTLSVPFRNTPYYWRVATRDSQGVESPWSAVTSFYNSTSPLQPTATAPANGAAFTNRTPTLSWTFIPNFAGQTQGYYKVEVATNPSFSPLAYDTGWVNSTATSYVLPSSPDGTYYWRVSTTDATGWYGSPASVTRSFSIDNVAPNDANASVTAFTSTTATISWSAFSDTAPSSGYWGTAVSLRKWNGSVWVQDNAPIQGTVALGDGNIGFTDNRTTMSLVGLVAGTQYQYFVTHRDNAGAYGPYSWTTFTTNTVPIASLPYLSNGTLYNRRPRIKISGTDANGDSLLNLHLQFSTVNTFATTVVDAVSASVATGWNPTTIPSGGASIYTPQVDLPLGAVYVRARVGDGKDWSNWTPTITLTIAAPNWTDTVTDSLPGIRKPWIDELRTKVNAVRATRGLSAYSFTDPVIVVDAANPQNSTDIRALHITQLRTAIQDAATTVSITHTWEEPSPTDRKGKHINEIRAAVTGT